MTEKTAPAPAVWMGCLAAYNAGILHGEWIELDADENAEILEARVREILATSPEPAAEEWHLCDAEHFGGWTPDRYESLETIARVADAIARHGLELWTVAFDAADDVDEALELVARPPVAIADRDAGEDGRSSVMESLVTFEVWEAVQAAITGALRRTVGHLETEHTNLEELARAWKYDAESAATTARASWGWEFGEGKDKAAAWNRY